MKKAFIMKHTDKREVTKQLWLTDPEIQGLVGELRHCQNPQHLIAFELLLLTGHKFSRLAKAKWGDFNARLGLLYLNDKTIRLPVATVRLLSELRESARCESDPILTIKYKKFWAELARASARLGIREQGVLTIRNTFARRHWQTYQSRKHLRTDLGLTSLRYLPKEIFQEKPLALFQF